MSALAALRSPCAASVSPRVEQQQQQQMLAAGAGGRRRGTSVAVSASTPSSSSSSRFSSPQARTNVLARTNSMRSMRAQLNQSQRSVRNVSATAEASSSDETIKPSSASATSTSTTTTVPSIPQDTIPSTPATFREWELDFGSRPVLDERGKKWWELLIVAKGESGDSEAPWVYSRWLPNTKINSAQLKSAISEIASQPGASSPSSVRFFRGAMQNIITRALTESGIKPVPSRRCFALYDELERRAEAFYPKMPGFSATAPPPFGALDATAFGAGAGGGGAPAQLPDALRGEAWAFVQLPLEELAPELEAVREGAVFGAVFEADAGSGKWKGKGLPAAGTPIPGVAVYSRRALPLAAWTAGYEVASLTADPERRCLVLDTGVNQRWRYGAVAPGAAAADEAAAWESAKAAAGGLHFLVIQEDDEADVAGLWLLLDRAAPNV